MIGLNAGAPQFSSSTQTKNPCLDPDIIDSSSLHEGMMYGAPGSGMISDTVGRDLPMHALDMGCVGIGDFEPQSVGAADC